MVAPSTPHRGVDPRRDLGIEIKRIADGSSLLKKQVAHALGVTPALLSNWFAGRAVPSKEQLDALAAFAGRSAIDPEPLRGLWLRARRFRDDATDPNKAEELTAFLGADVTSDGLALVYPEFVLSDGRLVPKHGAEIHSDLAKSPAELTGERLGGFGSVVSSHDLGAIAHVTEVLSSCGVRFRLAVDAEFTRSWASQPIMAFGLKSNAVTTFYLQSAKHRPTLFETRSSGGELAVSFKNGDCFVSEAPIWRGVLARVTPRPTERPARKLFFCAGLGGVGTALAASYLSLFWRDLHREVGDADFAVVVAGHEMATASPEREALYRAG